ncbi:Ferrichrome receptor FcuA precursor [compost metagenome]
MKAYRLPSIFPKDLTMKHDISSRTAASCSGFPLPPMSALTPIAFAMQVLFAGAIIMSVLPGQAYAAEPQAASKPATHNFNIPAGPLSGAIARFSSQSGAYVSVNGALTDGKTSQGVQGNLSVPEAITRLLAGTGLEALAQTNGSYILRVAPLTTSNLPEVMVTSDLVSASELPKAFAGGQVARGSRVGILGNVDIFETPFSTQSFTEEFVQDQQSRRVADIISVDPSIRSAMAEYGDSETYIVRGFPLFVNQVGVNGLYGMTEGRRITPEFYERIDVLKGPAAMLNGISPFGVVGGNVNLTSKRADDKPLTRVTGSYVSDSQFGVHLDLGRRFGEDNAWGVRLNLLKRDGDTPIERQNDHMKNGALALDYRGKQFKASLDFSNQDRLTNGYSANIIYADNIVLPRPPQVKNNYVDDWEFIKTNAKYWMAHAEYEFSPAVTVYANYGNSSGNEEYYYGGASGRRFTNSAGDFTARAGGFRGAYDAETYDIGLRGKFMLGDISNTYALSYSDFSRQGYGLTVLSGAAYTGNVYNSTPNRPRPVVNYGRLLQNADLQLSSVGLVNTFGFMNDNVLLTLGLRHQELFAPTFASGVRTGAYDQSKVTPTAALLVKLGSYSLYTNYSEGLAQGAIAPASGVNNPNVMLPPSVTKQVEGGVKYNAGTFGLTAAVFQIAQPNALRNASGFYAADGEQRNRGLELSTFGQPLRGVRLLGGVTLIDAVQTKTLGGAFNGKDAIGVPKVNIVLNGEYDVDAIQGFTLTGRINAFSSAKANQTNTQSIPGWRTLDVGARYVTQVAGKAVTFRANVINLTNRNYWNSVSRGFITLGAPRTALLSASIDF